MNRLADGLDIMRAKLDAASEGLAVLAGWVFIAGALFITFDILARRFLGFSSKATVEIAGYMLAVGSALGFMYALKTRAHIRVDVVLNLVPMRLQGYLSWLALFWLSAFLVFMTWRVWDLVGTSFRENTTAVSIYNTPLGWPESIWAVGISLFALMAFVMFLQATLDVLRGRAESLATRFGPSGVEDEATQAVEAAAGRIEAPTSGTGA